MRFSSSMTQIWKQSLKFYTHKRRAGRHVDTSVVLISLHYKATQQSGAEILEPIISKLGPSHQGQWQKLLLSLHEVDATDYQRQKASSSFGLQAAGRLFFDLGCMDCTLYFIRLYTLGAGEKMKGKLHTRSTHSMELNLVNSSEQVGGI